MIRHLEEHCRSQVDSEQYAVMYLYLDYKQTKLQSYSNLIRSILKQLLMGQDRPSLCPQALDFIEQSKKGVRPNDGDVLGIIHASILSRAFRRVYLVVDALDEYPEEERAILLDTLQSIPPRKMSLFLTTRPSDEIKASYVQCESCSGYLTIYFHCTICQDFDICQDCKDQNKSCRWGHELSEPKTIFKEIKAPDSEIKRFVLCTLNEELDIAGNRNSSGWVGNATYGATRLALSFSSHLKQEPELISKITEKVVRTADGMFLLAKLHVNSLRLQPNPAAIWRALDDLSPEVGHIYSGILARIKDQRRTDVDLAMQALSWVFLAHRPLSVEELVQAMAVEVSKAELNIDEQTHFNIILRVTMGLIVNEGAVRTAHRTAQEYFEKHWKEYFPEGQIHLARSTLKCLNYTALSSPCSGEREDKEISSKLQKYPFLSYATTYWGEHIQEAVDDDMTQEAVLKFLQNPSRLHATIQMAWYVGSRSQVKATWDVRAGVNAMHVCAWYGLGSFITKLLSQTPYMDVNSQDQKLGQTPLMYACLRGHSGTASTLLRLGADVNLMNNKGATAAFLALSNEYPELVDLMLTQEGVSPSLDLNAANEADGATTILMVAALKAYKPLLSHLLELPEVDKNTKNIKGYTALALAATKSDPIIVETLLDHVDVNTPNNIGSTPLIIAAEGGKADMVTAMLKKNADWRPQNQDGDTAFSKAVIHGHVPVVKALLNHGVEHHVAEGSKRTLLHVACSSEKTKPEMIDLLVEKGLEINEQGDRGDTPLHNATRIGNIEVTRSLLVLGADQLIEDHQHRTPITVAWQNGHSNLVKLFQSHAKHKGFTSANLPEDSHLPLWSMAKLGHETLLQEALHKENPTLHERDPDTESTALHWAIRTNNLEIARLLLEAGAKTSEVDDHKRTPLHIATYTENYEATELLLEFQADPTARSSWDLTPYAIALSRKSYPLATKLLEVLVARPDEASRIIDEGSPRDTQATFCAAVQMGLFEVVLLLAEHKVDLEGRDERGKTVIELAEGSGNDELLDWLRRRMFRSDQETKAVAS